MAPCRPNKASTPTVPLIKLSRAGSHGVYNWQWWRPESSSFGLEVAALFNCIILQVQE
jgi:hypothetical protein